jgi:hypothetical protein
MSQERLARDTDGFNFRQLLGFNRDLDGVGQFHPAARVLVLRYHLGM